jgi:hypothetical protein
MSIESYTFIPYRLQDHKIQHWKKKLVALCSRDTTEFWGPKKPFSRVLMDKSPLKLETTVTEKVLKLINYNASQFLKHIKLTK